jgi:hypothetical protein
MLKIILDMYSGRENPEWTLTGATAHQILNEIARNPQAISALQSGFGGLGVRGLILEIQDASTAQRFGLPMVFRLASGVSSNEMKAVEISKVLLDLFEGLEPSQKEEVLHELVRLPEKAKLFPPDSSDAPAKDTSVDDMAPAESDASISSQVTINDEKCKVEVGVFNAPFWNGVDFHKMNNNCYNYATNRRTGTFAQPGRASGNPIKEPTLKAVIAAALSDGSERRGVCQGSAQMPRWVMALVTTPDEVWNWDFHWYRRQTYDICAGMPVRVVWGHKPGRTYAIMTDNAGNDITDPEKADRGIYTQWGGYWFSTKKMVVD